MKAKFTVLGEPKGKGRPRFVPQTGRAITPKDTVQYENLVKLEYQTQCRDPDTNELIRFPDGAMLDLRIIAYYGIPASKSKKAKEQMKNGLIRPTKKPDMDNVVKAIADSLNNIAYHDDTQIVDCQIRKFYSEQPRVEVSITEVAPKAKEDK